MGDLRAEGAAAIPFLFPSRGTTPDLLKLDGARNGRKTQFRSFKVGAGLLVLIESVLLKTTLNNVPNTTLK